MEQTGGDVRRNAAFAGLEENCRPKWPKLDGRAGEAIVKAINEHTDELKEREQT